MATYVTLIKFTAQGIKNIQDTVKRANDMKAQAQKMGVKIKDIYWTLGKYDGVIVSEAPDDETATALSLSSSAHGNVQTQTARAFTAEELTGVLKKMTG